MLIGVRALEEKSKQVSSRVQMKRNGWRFKCFV